MKKLLLILVVGVHLLADGVDIYTNKVIVEKSGTKFSVPFALDMSEIEISSNCNITNAYFTNFRKIEDENSRKKDELTNRLLALKDSYEIIKNSKPNEISNLSEILSQNLNEQSSITSALSLLSTVDSEVLFVKDLIVNAPCKGVSIRYPDYGAKLDSKNTITFKNGKLTIKQNVTVSNLDANFTSARVRFFPYSANFSQTPAIFTPVYLQKEPQAQIPDAPATMMKMANATLDAGAPNLRASEQTLHTFNFWQIDKANLKAKEDNLLALNSQEVNATFSNFIDGYGSSRAYFMLSFVPEFDVWAAKSDYYFDDKFIQSNYINKMLKGMESKLYFGINNFIEVKKEVSDIKTDESLFGGKETTKNSWTYEIKNSSDKEQAINFVERIPVSTHEDIKVVMLGDIGVEAQKDGRVELNFTIKPNETKSFKFGYAVTKPATK